MQHGTNSLTRLIGAITITLAAACGGGGSATPVGEGAGSGSGGGGGQFGEGGSEARGALFLRDNAFGGEDIFGVALDGETDPQRLTQHTTEVVNEVFETSVTGVVAYTTYDGSDTRYRSIRLDGSAPPTTLLGAGEASFAYRVEVFGSQLVYARSGSLAHVMSVDIETGQSRVLAEHEQGSLYFNGNYVTTDDYLVYSHQPSGSSMSTVYAVALNAETSTPVQLSTSGVDSDVYYDAVRDQVAIHGNTVIMLETASTGGRQLTGNDPTTPMLRPLLELPNSSYSLRAWTVVGDHFVALRRDPSFVSNLFATALSGGPIRMLSAMTQEGSMRFSPHKVGANGIAFTVTRYSSGSMVEARVSTVDLDDPATLTEVSDSIAFPFDPDSSSEFWGLSVVGETLLIQRSSQRNDVSYATYGVEGSETLLAADIDLPYQLALYAGNQTFNATGVMNSYAVVVDGNVLLAVRPETSSGDIQNLWSVRPGQAAIPLSDVGTTAIGSIGTIHTLKSGRAVYSRGVLHYAVTLGEALSEVRITNNGFAIEPVFEYEYDMDADHALFYGAGQLLAARIDGSTDLITLTHNFGQDSDESQIQGIHYITATDVIFKATQSGDGPRGVYITPLDDDPTTAELDLSRPFDSDDELVLLF